MLETLLTHDAILADLWSRLHQGKADPNHPFHWPGIATINEIQGVTARTVVLRRVDEAPRLLWFHTDRRSAKFADLLNDATVAWLFYDHPSRLQVRVHSQATLHTNDAVAQEQWVAAPGHMRELYRTPLSPGAVLPQIHSAKPTGGSDGRDHFAVVSCKVESIDWLYLHPNAHRRARFSWSSDDLLTAEWLAP
jgi:pyridoxamine 5'-phosphate oxidase